MTIWSIVLTIAILPYLMFFTARAIHQDDGLKPKMRGWLAAAVVLLAPIAIPVYWLDRLQRQRRARA